MGDDTPTVVDWTAHDAINDLDGQGRSTNVLAVEVGSSQVRFLVNGTEVATQPRSAVDTDGITGLRVTQIYSWGCNERSSPRSSEGEQACA